MKTTNIESFTSRDNNVRKNLAALSPTSTPFNYGFRRFSAECSQIIAELKDRVVADLANEFRALNALLVRQVVNEADSLAATTPFPALLLPVLAEEKVRNASTWAARQQAIRGETLSLAA